MAFQTRKPTGKPPWPILLLAGVEKSGKSYAAAVASKSDLVGHTYWISVGEDDPDEYGQIGAFDIVLHDGTYRGILTAVTQATQQPQADAKPNLLVLDSAGRIWALLSESAQHSANERAARKGNAVGDDGADITMDLWNTAKQRWGHILDALRQHDGPVIITARLDEVTVVENGKPSKAKQWKVQAEKNLPFDVGAIVQFHGFGEAYLTGVRSLRYRREPSELSKLPADWTIDGLWRQLGLADDAGPRQHTAAVAQGEAEEQATTPLSDTTRRRLFALMGQMVGDDADRQRAFLSDTLGREVESRSTLTEAEGIRAGQRLRAWEKGDDTAVWKSPDDVPDPHDGADPWAESKGADS